MNCNHEEIPDADRRRFDLLADGELSEAERHALLLSLDHRPNGWRHCALALLEAQCWSRETAAIGGRRARPVVARPRVPSAGRSSISTRWATLAASLVAAFLLGIATRTAMTPDAGMESGYVAHSEPHPSGPPAEFARTPVAAASGRPLAQDYPDSTHDLPSADVDTRALGPGQDGTSSALVEPSNHEAFEPAPEADVVTFWVRADGGPLARAVQVPLVSATGLGQDGPPPHVSVIPGAVLQGLRQAGHQIRFQRRYAPLELDDGRQIVFPVDDVEIIPVSVRTY